MKADFLGRGWRFPVTLENGMTAFAEAEELIRESILIILGTAKGERVMRPDFGCSINELVFAPNNTSTATLIEHYVQEALLEWEPRIETLNVKAVPDPNETNRLNIEIEYRIVAANTEHNLVYPFYLEKAGR